MTAPSTPPEMPARYRRRRGWIGPALLFAGAATVAAAVHQTRRARRAEAAFPPRGAFADVAGTRVHFTDTGGDGPAVVLVHGVGSTLDDWHNCGLVALLAGTHRVIAFDRPGYGHSPRPGGTDWTPERQAVTIGALMDRLGIADAVIVGHSFGVLPAIALAVHQPQKARALVLLGGVYYPGAPLISAVETVPHIPLLAGLARRTITPSLARAVGPQLVKAMFDPQPVPPLYSEREHIALAARPAQLAASSADAEAINPAVTRLARHYAGLSLPVTLISGEGDAVFAPAAQSARFASALPHARNIVVPDVGHMLHHAVAARIAAAIAEAAAPRALPAPATLPAEANV